MTDYQRRYPASIQLVDWARQEINFPARAALPAWARPIPPSVRHVPKSSTWRSPVLGLPQVQCKLKYDSGAVTDRFRPVKVPWPRSPTTPSRHNKRYAALDEHEFTCVLPRRQEQQGSCRRHHAPAHVAIKRAELDSSLYRTSVVGQLAETIMRQSKNMPKPPPGHSPYESVRARNHELHERVRRDKIFREMKINIGLRYVVKMQALARRKLAIIHTQRDRTVGTSAAVVLQAFWRMKSIRDNYRREKTGRRLRQLIAGAKMINNVKGKILRCPQHSTPFLVRSINRAMHPNICCIRSVYML